MDRIQVCGTCDAGSIPAESTKCKKHFQKKCFLHFVLSENDACASFVRNRIGVAESPVLCTHKTRRGDRTSCREHILVRSTKKLDYTKFLENAIIGS